LDTQTDLDVEWNLLPPAAVLHRKAYLVPSSLPSWTKPLFLCHDSVSHSTSLERWAGTGPCATPSLRGCVPVGSLKGPGRALPPSHWCSTDAGCGYLRGEDALRDSCLTCVKQFCPFSCLRRLGTYSPEQRRGREIFCIMVRSIRKGVLSGRRQALSERGVSIQCCVLSIGKFR
jgi:hypothetical protein